MSRHRMVRNLSEDDYYDDYDDGKIASLLRLFMLFFKRTELNSKLIIVFLFHFVSQDYYDEDDYYEDDDTQQQYTPPNYFSEKTTETAPTSQKLTQPTKSFVAVPGKVATTVSVGVTKPPLGWGKPSSKEPPSASMSTVSISSGATKPPPGWGKPNASVGVLKPPPGWGKPITGSNTSAGASNSKASSVGVSKPPPGWDKPSTVTAENSSKSSTSKRTTQNSSNSKTVPYIPKRVPDVLKSPKSQLSMVVLGHVDAGKSTLMGQVLVQVGKVSKREAQKNPVSWILDENEQERQRGVTMEIGTKTVR